MAKVMFTVVGKQLGWIGPNPSDITVVLDNLVTNVGQAYNLATGEFRAPHAGNYYFTFFYHAGPEVMSGLTLMKNKEVIVKAYDDNQKRSGQIDNAGNAAFLQLNVGDKVYLRLPANTQIYASEHTTSFSGFMVAEF